MKRLKMINWLWLAVALMAQLCYSMDAKSERSVVALQARLLADFDVSIQDMEHYQQRVVRECAIFPEANLFPYVLPALAYGNLALKEPSYRPIAVDAIARLMVPAIYALEAQLKDTRECTILSLSTYAERATELGQINLALALYKRIEGKDVQLLQIHEHLNQLLSQALAHTQGKPLRSYPKVAWPFDTMPCIVSLLLSDPGNSAYQGLARAHLDWIELEGIHPPTGLPYGEMGRKLPRGCDLSLRLPLMHHFAPEQAQAYYARYSQIHWAGLGFREWPVGFDEGVDIDSGPILNGIGLYATGNGIATALVFDDRIQINTLLGLLNQRDMWVSLYQTNSIVRETIVTQFEEQFVPIDTRYFTGFLYGDAALFYMLTWEDYGLTLSDGQQRIQVKVEPDSKKVL